VPENALGPFAPPGNRFGLVGLISCEMVKVPVIVPAFKVPVNATDTVVVVPPGSYGRAWTCPPLAQYSAAVLKHFRRPCHLLIETPRGVCPRFPETPQ